jgi:regulator of sigma D
LTSTRRLPAPPQQNKEQHLDNTVTDAIPDARRSREGTRHLIEEMLAQRTRMLKLLWQLSRQEIAREDETLREVLDDFLSVLVDYIAAGHFGLYDRLARGAERRTAVVDTARDLYPRIAEITRAAVDFNERHGGGSPATSGPDLVRELSQIVEQLALRIELEDRLIDAMLGPAARPATGT